MLISIRFFWVDRTATMKKKEYDPEQDTTRPRRGMHTRPHYVRRILNVLTGDAAVLMAAEGLGASTQATSG